MTIKLENFIDEINTDFELIKKTIGIFKELEKVSEDNISHKNYSVSGHTKIVYENAIFFIDFISHTLNKTVSFDDRSKNIFLMKCILHDIGKLDTGIYTEDGKVFPKHELRGAELADGILGLFELGKKEESEIIEFIKNHTKIHQCLDGGIDKFNKNLKEFKLNHDNIKEYIIFCLADTYRSYLEESNPSEYLYRINTLLNVI